MAGFVALTARQIATNAIALAKLVLIVTLLPVAEYGVYVIANGFFNYLIALSGLGFGAFLMRSRESPSRDLIGTARVLALMVGCASVVVAALVAPSLAAWYQRPALAALFVVQTLAVPMALLRSILVGLLDRELRFQRSASLDLVAELLGFLVTSTIIWLTRSPWGLVWGNLVQAVVCLWLFGRSTEHPYVLAWHAATARRLLKFGFELGAAGWVAQLRRLVNPVLVAKMLGPEASAVVAIAIRTLELVGFVMGTIGRLAIGAFSALTASGRPLDQALAKAQAAQMLSVGAVMIMLVAIAPDVVALLPGAHWQALVPLLPPLCAAAIIATTFNLYFAILQVRAETRLMIVANALFVLVFFAIAGLLLWVWPDIRAYGVAEIVATLSLASLWPMFRKRIPEARLGWVVPNLIMMLLLTGVSVMLWGQPLWLRLICALVLTVLVSISRHDNREVWRMVLQSVRSAHTRRTNAK